MHFEDLSQVAMVDSGEHVRAIGWLHHEHEYPQGPVPAAFVHRLWEFARRAGASSQVMTWSLFRGLHTCEFCREFRSSGNLGIPSGELLYVAPEMIAHYVERHAYLPPREFQSAVMEAPLPDADEYRQQVTPFRSLYLGKNRQRSLWAAADWVHRTGATDEVVRQAAAKFLEDDSPEACAEVRAVMKRR